MNSQSPAQVSQLKPYVRPSRLELEPAVFALAVIGVVMSISLWKPVPADQQVTPQQPSQTQTLAQAPRH
ncbi:MAG: hypothetical protein Q7U99_23260 [Rubrivivax sp.]|nr:hypothetical protein [Rubrivivax sp.]MDP3224854.1 hypothetical protein [Rubrivivax sp.]